MEAGMEAGSLQGSQASIATTSMWFPLCVSDRFKSRLVLNRIAQRGCQSGFEKVWSQNGSQGSQGDSGRGAGEPGDTAEAAFFLTSQTAG